MPSKSEDKLIVSHDGSHTIESSRFGVTYHSAFGALEESLTVFLSAGYHHVRLSHKPDQLNVLEVGFGTGLNAWLTMLEAQRYHQLTTYTGIEAYPIGKEISDQLNYSEQAQRPDQAALLDQLHAATPEQQHRVVDYGIFTKWHSEIEQWSSANQYDVIYFDAFAPTAQPELWTPAILQKMYDLTKANGVLVTYCAKGQFKRDLAACGYTVEALPGPGRKREMTRAIKK